MANLEKFNTIEIGGGTRPIHPNWFQVDVRKLPNVSIQKDARVLPFQSNQLSTICSSYLLPCFTKKEAKEVLEEWFRCLKSGGKLELYLPDLEQISRNIISIGNEEILKEIYGSQDHEVNYFKWGYTQKTIDVLLSKVGFVRVSFFQAKIHHKYAFKINAYKPLDRISPQIKLFGADSLIKIEGDIDNRADLNFITILNNACGYSVAAEQLILGLTELGYKVKVISHEDRNIEYNWMSREFKELVKKDYGLADKTIIFTPPIFMRNHHKIGKTFAYTMFETETIEKEAVDRLNSLDGVIVTCKHSKQAFERSGVKHKISLAHLCIDYDYYAGNKIPHDKFTFISHGTHSTRKGTDLMVKAFVEEFNKETDVKLILKDTTAGASNYKLPFENIKIERKVGNIAPIELRNLLLAADCGLYPSRGEGWGLGAMEAMATGLPTILTDYGGHSAMCNEKYNYLLKVAELISSRSYYFPLSRRYENIGKWAQPDINHLKGLMRYVYENQKKAKEKGRLAAQWIKRKFNRKKQAELVVSAIGLNKYEIIKNPKI